jgi:hypothetical protein
MGRVSREATVGECSVKITYTKQNGYELGRLRSADDDYPWLLGMFDTKYPDDYNINVYRLKTRRHNKRYWLRLT